MALITMDHNPFDDGEPLTTEECFALIALTLTAAALVCSIAFGAWLFCNT